MPQYRLLSDEELVYRFAQRNEEAAMFMIYERYGHLVLGVCMACLHDVSLAEKVTEEVFIKLLEDLPRFNLPLFRPWLLQVCRNQCQMQLRKMGKNLEAMPGTDPFAPETIIPEGLSGDLVSNTLAQAVKQLSPEQESFIKQFYEQRKPYAAIAADTGLSGLQVKQQIQEGKILLSNKILQLLKLNES